MDIKQVDNKKSDILKQFEYPLPVIQVDTDNISIETSECFEGGFCVSNIGGGELFGTITSNSHGLEFSPTEFRGNNIKITYRFNLDIYKKGDTIHTSALITSNGGEAIIPVLIKIIPPAVIAKDGSRLGTLKDFLLYVKKSPVESRKLFSQKEFLMWLLSMNYEHMDMYEHFARDPNKERAIDNFLVLNGLKNKAEISVIENRLSTRIRPAETDAVTGVIPLRLKGWGYLDERIEIINSKDTPWIKLMTDSITAADFDEAGFFEASYIIYPNLLRQKFASATLRLVNTNTNIFVNVCKENPLDLSLSRQSFGFEDMGRIIVINNTFKDMMLEVLAEDTFIKFEGKRYLVSGYAEIPFSVRLTGLAAAQFALKKQPVLETFITVKAYVDEKPFKKVLKVFIGGLYFEA